MSTTRLSRRTTAATLEYHEEALMDMPHRLVRTATRMPTNRADWALPYPRVSKSTVPQILTEARQEGATQFRKPLREANGLANHEPLPSLRRMLGFPQRRSIAQYDLQEDKERLDKMASASTVVEAASHHRRARKRLRRSPSPCLWRHRTSLRVIPISASRSSRAWRRR